MSSLILQPPVVSGTSVTLTFKVGTTPIQSFDITLDFDPAVVNVPTVAVLGPDGWNINHSPIGSSSVRFQGNGTGALSLDENAFSVSFNVLPGAGQELYVGWSGTYNNPPVDVPLSAITYRTGTPNADYIAGSEGNDAIQGLAGDDLIDGQGGDDTLSGGEGLDAFSLGSGSALILDPQFGEYLYVPGAYLGEFEFVPGVGYVSNLQDPTQDGPLAGEVQWASENGVTSLFIGLDSIAGADLTVYLKGSFQREEIQAYQEYIDLNHLVGGALTISGTPTQGQTLTVVDALTDADGLGTRQYQWLADLVDIPNATGASLLLTQDVVGMTISVVGEYQDANGMVEFFVSEETPVVANVNDLPTGSVTISGTPTQGETLTAANTLADIDGIPISGAGAITYQWKADGTPISGATSGTYMLTQAEVGKFITVTASYTDLQGTPESITSDPTATAVADVNDAPTGILYENPVLVLPEDSDVSEGILVATIVAEDDTVGTNLAELSGGADESLFELREGGELWLRSTAGPLDFETKTSFNVRIKVYDPQFADAPVIDDFRLLISNVVETPVPEPTVVLELPPAESADPNDSAAQQAYANWLLSVEAVAPPLDVPGAVQGDGNGDGLPDAEQASVGSRPFVISPTASTAPPTTEQTFVTLVAESTDGKSGSSAAAILENIRQDDAPADLPADISFPLGVIRFDAAVDQVGKTENFSLYVNAGLGITGYWKLNTEGVWVNLASAPYGGKMEVEGGRLRLDFQITDGGAFDNDGVANGVIADPGALGVVSLSLAGAVPDIPAGAVWF